MHEYKNEFTLVGLSFPGKTRNQDGQSAKDCGNLWQKFEKDNIFDAIPGKVSNEVFAVYHDYEKDENAPFAYFIGCKVEKGSEIPDGLTKLIIPVQAYQKFTAKGVMTGCIADTWKEIWSTDLPRKFGFDFEVYDERSRDWTNAEVDIYISIVE